jgi:hypothetical protein
LSLGAPAECSSASSANFYNQGFSIQKNVVRYLWERNFRSDCTQLESFIDAINLPFGFDQPASPGLRCRNTGLADGLIEAINDVTDSCTTECLSSGSATGEILGTQVCNASNQKTLYQLKLCGFTAEQSCRSALVSYVGSHCPDKNQDALNLAEFACKF